MRLVNLLDEREVIRYLKLYFEGKGWKPTKYDSYFKADFSAVKDDIRYVIEAKRDTDTNKSFHIKYAIGEIVAHMEDTEKEIRYGIALPHNLAVYLAKFGLRGLKALGIHIFIVQEWGLVWHLSPEQLIEYVMDIRKRGESAPSLFDSDP